MTRVVRLLFGASLWILAACAILFPDDASAQANNCAVAGECHQGIAYERCMADYKYSVDQENAKQGGGATAVKQCTPFTYSGMPSYECAIKRNTTWNQDCYKSGTVSGQRYYLYTGLCSTRSALGPGVVQSTTACDAGCQFASATGGIAISFPGVPGWDVARRTTDGWLPTGQVCAPVPEDTPSPDEECTPAVGGLTQCVKPNGDHCAFLSGSTTKFCWGAGESGDRVDPQTGDYGTKDPAGPRPPNSPPPDGQQYNPPTATGGANTTINNGPTTTNIISVGGSGPVGGGGTGGGSGGGSTGGGSGGECPQGQDCTGPGAPGSGVGDLYTRDDVTSQGEWQRLRDGLANAPIIEGVGNFFGSCDGAGTCPAESWNSGEFGYQFDLSDFCTGALFSLLQYAGWIALAGFALFAFKVALL